MDESNIFLGYFSYISILYTCYACYQELLYILTYIGLSALLLNPSTTESSFYPVFDVVQIYLPNKLLHRLFVACHCSMNILILKPLYSQTLYIKTALGTKEKWSLYTGGLSTQVACSRHSVSNV